MLTHIPRILLPNKNIDLSRWAVVACDQFTSEPAYWQEADRLVGDAPSTLRLTLPELYLDQDGLKERIHHTQETMRQYLSDGTLTALPPGIILTTRDTGGACPRRGLILAFDLEAYDYQEGSTSPIRPTEKTVVERIPPRLAVRQDAFLELPHIMLLIDDPERAIIEPLFSKTSQLEELYNVELMANGGHLTGWFMPQGQQTGLIQKAFERLADNAVFSAKYNCLGRPPLPFAVGDGNHSMATAKAAWEALKPSLSAAEQTQHPARFVLAEVVNIHDESLAIEPIHRVLFDVDENDLLTHALCYFNHASITATVPEATAERQVFPFVSSTRRGYLVVEHPKYALALATLQDFLDHYLLKHPGVKIDYIHGLHTIERLGAQPGNLGFVLPDLSKEDLFRGVVFDGVLPRKTFSMGEAREKRYYMEARCIK